ncbi:MAG: ATP synthase F1 subunit epsilon [bacterium]|nr:ATP synthase F1 subunit epsilon [bacterium]
MTLQLEIYTPVQEYLKKEVDMVIVPGKMGELGILPQHTPLLSLLNEGMVKIKTEGKWQEIKISEGYIEVGSNKVTILVDNVLT